MNIDRNINNWYYFQFSNIDNLSKKESFMKKHPVILLFGNTCVGKSSVGIAIERATNGSVDYVSFGDCKRELALTDPLRYKKMTRNESGKSFLVEEIHKLMLENIHSKKASIFSGYPISIDEYSLFNSNFSCIAAMHLTINEDVLLQRFFSRGICPICQSPGKVGEACKEHNTSMIPRNDLSDKTLYERQVLYERRIIPFVEHLRSQGIAITTNANENAEQLFYNVTILQKLLRAHT